MVLSEVEICLLPHRQISFNACDELWNADRLGEE